MGQRVCRSLDGSSRTIFGDAASPRREKWSAVEEKSCTDVIIIYDWDGESPEEIILTS